MPSPEKQSAAPLDPWIIDEIRRREQEEQNGERPVLEIPLDGPRPKQQDRRPNNPSDDRGVVRIDIDGTETKDGSKPVEEEPDTNVVMRF